MIASADPGGHRPRVVALGGGRGLATMLEALRTLDVELTAVVSMADDGGSTGRLRGAGFDVVPGDIRKCLIALADDRPLAESLAVRFDGHPVGNLLLTALSGLGHRPTDAVRVLANALGVQATVVPVTDIPLVLHAATHDGTVSGQVAVSAVSGIERVWVEPADARPVDEVIDALKTADWAVIGPGSLYSSVLAVMVVDGVREALSAGATPIVYVANLSPEASETAGYGLGEHIEALDRHDVIPSIVLVDDATPLAEMPVRVPLYRHRLRGESGDQHDPQQLATALAEVFGLGSASRHRSPQRGSGDRTSANG